MQMPAFGPVLRSCAIAAVVAMAASGGAWAQSLSGGDLVAALRQGGYVIVMRHATSPQISPDANKAAPGNAGLERQLDENGHKTAHAMGEALRALQIPIGDVLSSPTFRTRETVNELAFPNPKLFNELGDGSKGYEISRGTDGPFLRARSVEIPRAGTNTIIITHLPNVQSAFGAARAGGFEEGEVMVLRPDGGSRELVARVKIEEWPRLAAQR